MDVNVESLNAAYLKRFERADERTLAADPLITSDSRALLGIARGCRFALPKGRTLNTSGPDMPETMVSCP